MRTELEAVANAIQRAYLGTSQQISARGYHPKVLANLYGQLLHFNVSQNVVDLKAVCSSLDIGMVPNRRRTAHHVIVKARGMRLTIAAVAESSGQPRYAHFRESYSKQFEFRFNVNSQHGLTPSAVKYEYLELLHYPKATDRYVFGGMVVAFPNERGEYLTAHMPWGHFLDTFFGVGSTSPSGVDSTSPSGVDSTSPSKVEVIEDPFASLKVIQPSEHQEA